MAITLLHEKDYRNAKQHLLHYLQQKGKRKTPERFAVLEGMYSFENHFTIDELEKRLHHEMHFRVSRPTLYNTINLFLELRFIVRHNFFGATKYEVTKNDANHCHQVCTQCGKVTEVEIPGVEALINQTRLLRFRKEIYTLYIYGVCSSCLAKQTRNKKKTNETEI